MSDSLYVPHLCDPRKIHVISKVHFDSCLSEVYQELFRKASSIHPPSTIRASMNFDSLQLSISAILRDKATHLNIWRRIPGESCDISLIFIRFDIELGTYTQSRGLTHIYDSFKKYELIFQLMI